jgi:hypothetical protein
MTSCGQPRCFSKAEEYLAEAMWEAIAMPQLSTEEGCQAIQRIQELMAAAADRIPAPRDVSTTRSQMPWNSRARQLYQANRFVRHHAECHQGPVLQPGGSYGGRRGDNRYGIYGGRHNANGGGHIGSGGDDDSGNDYYFNDKGDTLWQEELKDPP